MCAQLDVKELMSETDFLQKIEVVTIQKQVDVFEGQILVPFVR